MNEVLSKRYTTKIFYENSYRLHDNYDRKKVFYLANRLDYFKVKSIIKMSSIKRSDQYSIYIHDSGLFGLLLCSWWSKFSNVYSITFDYHDWIPWEISYQIGKRIKSPKIVKILSNMTESFFKKALGSISIDNLVGISESQIEELKKDFKLLGSKHLVVPNTRNKLSKKRSINDDEFSGVLWIGNVMKGRDLDILCTYINKYNDRRKTNVYLYIIGNIFDKDYFRSLESLGHIKYLDAFRNDLDVFEKIKNYNVAGFFYGWDDTYETGINKIASPNKAYSYINLGIPTVMGKHMCSLRASFENSTDSIFWIDGYTDFEKSIDYIKVNYSTIINDFDVQTKWEDDIQKDMTNFFLE